MFCVYNHTGMDFIKLNTDFIFIILGMCEDFSFVFKILYFFYLLKNREYWIQHKVKEDVWKACEN